MMRRYYYYTWGKLCLHSYVPREVWTICSGGEGHVYFGLGKRATEDDFGEVYMSGSKQTVFFKAAR
jgi:hypothetical protein